MLAGPGLGPPRGAHVDSGFQAVRLVYEGVVWKLVIVTRATFDSLLKSNLCFSLSTRRRTEGHKVYPGANY